MDPSRRSRTALFGALAALTLVIGIAAPAGAEFPYKSGTGDSSDPYAYEKYMYIDDAETDFPPNDPKLTDPYEDFWKYTSKDACEVYGLPDNAEDLANHRCDPTVVANPQELFGVMGASVDLAWETSTGRPDVVIAVQDSGIEWGNVGAMRDLARKTWLNAGELPEPDWGTRNAAHPYDRNGDGVFNIVDYCGDIEDEVDCGGQGDSRVRGAAGNDTDFNANGLIDPEELIFLFSDGIDDDDNGYVDDFVGWDTFEDDNDPYDEPSYGHGTGEAKDSTAETDNGVDMGGTCPNCMVMHMRVGDSFVADVNDFAQGVLYATDNGASVIQSALGTLNNSRFAQEAINYAYNRGTVLIASAADESAGHHNQPSTLEHAVTMNSVGEPQVPGMMPRTYLEFRGCTNYGAYITASVPSNQCSSEAVGRSAGMAGLIYSAARNELAKAGPLQDYGVLDGPGGVPPGMGLSAEELDQVIATTADDINFKTPVPMTERTGAGGHATERYPATAGWDPFFGYGRVNADRMVQAVAENKIPPEADISSPRWFEIVDPDDDDDGVLDVMGRVASLRSPKFSYTVEWAPWSWREPNTETSPAYTDEGVTLTAAGDRTQPVEGKIATIDMATLQAAVAVEALPNLDASGPAVDPATGRGDHENRNLPDKFGVILRVTATAKDAEGVELTDIDGDPLQGIGTKNFNLHRDPALFNGFPRFLEGDGAAAPRFADLNDDGKDDEMIVATSNGEIHAYENGGGELDGWPVKTTSILVNPGAPAYNSGEITPPHAAVLRTPAVGDLDRDGDLEVVAGDFQGRMWAWDKTGEELPGFPVRSNPFFSTPQMSDRAAGFYADNPELSPGNYPGPGALPNDPDLVPDLVNRRDKLNRTIFWFMAAPSLGNIDASDDDLEIVAGAGDRHLYAWHSDGEPVDGWPVMLRDPAIVDSVDPNTHEISQEERRWNGAKIVTSPSIGDLQGDGIPEVLSAVNEQYSETPNTDDPTLTGLQEALTVADMELNMGNQRLYAIYADGSEHGDGPGTPPNGHPNANAFLPGWPAKIATAFLELLPVVGNGPDGSAALGNVNGGDDLEAGIFATVGPAYILGPDGRSIYGQDEDGRDRTLSMSGAGPGTNSPNDSAASIPAVGGGIFTDLNEDGNLEFPAPAAGLGKLLDLALPDDQISSDNHLSVWETQGPRERQQAPAYPREVNDLQFLTTPASADIDGDGFEEVLEGTAYSDLHALDYEGDEPGMRTLAPDGWPKFTGGWSVAPPSVGDFNGDGQRDIAHVIREGELFLWEGNGADRCADASWPQFAHDGWNSNNLTLDAIRPNRIIAAPPTLFSEFVSLKWKAPGDDEVCGTAALYDFRRDDEPVTNDTFDSATPISDEPLPAEAGTNQAMTVQRETCDYYIGLRALDLRPVDTTQAQPANPSSVTSVKVPGTNQASCRKPVTLTYTGKTKGQVTDPTRLAAKLVGPNGPLAGRKLTFGFAGKTYEATTGNDGVAEVNVAKVPRPAQKRTVTVSFAGNDQLLPEDLSVPFTVRREDTVLKIIDGPPNTISARLQDKDSGKLIKRARVRFFVNGKLIGSDRTNDSGVASVKRRRDQRPGDVERAVFPRTRSFRGSSDKVFVP